MKVCGFTIVRNAIKYGYPVVESIGSVLPVCDQFIVAVGKSEDNTLELISSIDSPKIKIVETEWDESLGGGGRVLAAETNKAMDAIGSEFDWCFYIQADEVIHEKFYPEIKNQMNLWKDAPEVEGLLFKYLHFWGTYDYVGTNRMWYRNEIRIVRNDKSIRSYKDAQGFRKNDRKLNVKPIDAYVYHYGWVRSPDTIREKMSSFHALYHSGETLKEKQKQSEEFDYSQVGSVRRFTGSHPRVMKPMIEKLDWHVDIDVSRKNLDFKDYLLYLFEKAFGYRLFEYKNYKILK
ncbi:hypothetical protein BY457_103214 [Marinilabilia salmonicolor]|jgi:hypothetical protein|uniref:glycosyl transferase n=1 Tax=Marinilabilia salmonicolor TaxID=989 RepID=UPI000D0779F2|nr:glycosyl transferase [Marinilabilia salmonicolor]PRZ01399.1 hypothetical protein BY457_103214 [Marinilabilia salmonicolor]